MKKEIPNHYGLTKIICLLTDSMHHPYHIRETGDLKAHISDGKPNMLKKAPVVVLSLAQLSLTIYSTCLQTLVKSQADAASALHVHPTSLITGFGEIAETIFVILLLTFVALFQCVIPHIQCMETSQK
jgi:hypothetical protein